MALRFGSKCLILIRNFNLLTPPYSVTILSFPSNVPKALNKSKNKSNKLGLANSITRGSPKREYGMGEELHAHLPEKGKLQEGKSRMQKLSFSNSENKETSRTAARSAGRACCPPAPPPLQALFHSVLASNSLQNGFMCAKHS